MANFPFETGKYMPEADCYVARGEKKMFIDHDLFGISDRIKDIEDEYFILFDMDRGKYEVHSKANPKDTYCFTVPYKELDARVLEYCRKTHIANNKELMKDLNKQAELHMKHQKKRRTDILEDRSLELYQKEVLGRQYFS